MSAASSISNANGGFEKLLGQKCLNFKRMTCDFCVYCSMPAASLESISSGSAATARRQKDVVGDGSSFATKSTVIILSCSFMPQ